MITYERLKELVDYDRDTGVFKRKTSRYASQIGTVISGTLKKRSGRVGDQGLVFKLDGKQEFMSQMAWLYVYGCLPTEPLKYLDGNKENLKINNLYEFDPFNATKMNPDLASSGKVGVYRLQSGRFRSRARIYGIAYEKDFATEDEAADFYQSMLKEHRIK